jgi:hypothetical protein
MVKFMKKVHSEENFSRPFSDDKIQYFFIGKRPGSINYEPPEMLASKWLNLIKFMPKSIIQAVDPGIWHVINAKNNVSSHLDFSILFDDYSLEDYDFFFEIPSKMLIIFLNTGNEKIFQKLENLNRFFLVSSDDKEIYSRLKESKTLRSKAFRSQKTLFKAVYKLLLENPDITPEILEALKQKRVEKTAEVLQELDLEKTPNFTPAIVNIANIYQLLSFDNLDLLETTDIEHEKRSESLLKTSLALAYLSQQLKPLGKEELVNSPIFPTLILAYPFFNPDYNKLLKEKIHEAENESQSLLKRMRHFRFIEQDIKTYNYETDLDLTIAGVEPAFSISAAIKQRHTQFLDFVGYLHATFEQSPYIRVPVRGSIKKLRVTVLSVGIFHKLETLFSQIYLLM